MRRRIRLELATFHWHGGFIISELSRSVIKDSRCLTLDSSDTLLVPVDA